MRSTIALTLDITHAQTLPLDPQGIIDTAARAVTERLAADVQLLATASLQAATMETSLGSYTEGRALDDLVKAELAGCENGGDHVVTSNATLDAWCSRCGERLILPGFAGWSADYVPGVS